MKRIKRAYRRSGAVRRGSVKAAQIGHACRVLRQEFYEIRVHVELKFLRQPPGWIALFACCRYETAC